jgi:hypothetical protein
MPGLALPENGEPIPGNFTVPVNLTKAELEEALKGLMGIVIGS